MIQDSGCRLCELSSGCKTVCLMTEPKEADLLVILENPAEDDDIRGMVASSKSQKTVLDVLRDVVEADMGKVHVTYLVKCKVANKDVKPSDDQTAACLKYLKKEIRVVKPKVILAIGDTVMRVLTGVTGIVANRGQIFTKEFKAKEGSVTVSIVPTFSAYYASQSGNSMHTFATDIYKAYTLSQGGPVSNSKTKIVVCDKVSKVRELADYVRETGVMCYDFETTKIGKRGIYDEDFKVTLLSVSFQIGSSYTIPLNHFETPFNDKEIIEILGIMQELWADPAIRKIGHNLKFDMQVAYLGGAREFKGRHDDTMLMHHLYDEDSAHGLKDITDSWFPEFSGYENEIKRYKWDRIPLKLLCQYAGTDTDLTLRLCTILENYLLGDSRVYTIYRSLQMAAIKPLMYAEIEGMLIDEDKIYKNLDEAQRLLAKQETVLREHRIVKRFDLFVAAQKREKKIAELEEKASRAKGKNLLNYQKQINEIKSGILSVYEGVNFSSNPQLSALFYSKEGFGYKKVWSRKAGDEVESTGKEILMELPDKTGFIQEFLLWRTLSKTVSTYLIGITERLDRHGRVHTSFLQHGTETGRLSSQNPNLQNLSNVSKLKNETAIRVVKMVKQPFIAPKGWKFVQVDYSQAELRVVASFANETTMIDAYNRGEDLHALTASTMMDLTLAEFYKLDAKDQKEWRNKAKPVNFGLIYGMSAEGLVEYAKNNYGVTMTLEQATEWRTKYFKLYPKLLEYHATAIGKAQKFGYVRTLFGRKRQTPDIWAGSEYIRGMDERIAINSPVQGTAGEFTIFAAALLFWRIDRRVCKFVNTIHDSLIFYIREAALDSQLRIIKETCENLPIEKYFGRPLEHLGMNVDIEVSDTCWTEAVKYDLAA